MKVKVYKRLHVPKGFKGKYSPSRRYVNWARSWFGSRKERFYR